jgi:hypothetical protein
MPYLVPLFVQSRNHFRVVLGGPTGNEEGGWDAEPVQHILYTGYPNLGAVGTPGQSAGVILFERAEPHGLSVDVKT